MVFVLVKRHLVELQAWRSAVLLWSFDGLFLSELNCVPAIDKAEIFLSYLSPALISRFQQTHSNLRCEMSAQI